MIPPEELSTSHHSLRHLAALASAKFRPQTAEWRGGWRHRMLADAVDATEVSLTVHDLGPALRKGELPTHAPSPLISFTTSLRTAADANALAGSVGVDLKALLDNARTWAVELRFKHVPVEAVDPGPAPHVPVLTEGPLVGPYSHADRERVMQVIAEASALVWEGIQGEALVERAILDTSGRTAEEESARYWRSYLGLPGAPIAGALVEQDAAWRERWLALARRWRHRDSERAAEFAHAALASLAGHLLVTSATDHTVEAWLESWDPADRVLNSGGEELTPAEIARGIRAEFTDFEDRWPKLRVRTAGHVGALSGAVSEGLAVWRDFALAVLRRQGAIHSLRPATGLPTPADVLAPHETSRGDSEYVHGFRLAATVALHCSPWPLTSATLASTELRAPLELLARRLSLRDLETMPRDSPLAPNHRLMLLASLPPDDGTEHWLERMFTCLDAGTPTIEQVVDSALTRNEEDAPWNC